MTKSVTRRQNYVGGEWVESKGGRTIVVDNPATGKPYAEITAAPCRMWTLPCARRARRSRRAPSTNVRNMASEIVPVLGGENGKSVGFAEAEVECAAQYLECYGGFAEKRRRGKEDLP